MLSIARGKGLRALRWGSLYVEALPAAWPSEVDVVAVDRIGLLRAAYMAADASFIGGSTVEGPGGHNLLEAVVGGCPLCAGPHLANVRDQQALLWEADAMRTVRDVEELAKFWFDVIEKPHAFRRSLVQAQKQLASRCGALGRTVACLLPLIVEPAGEPPTGSSAGEPRGRRPS